MARKFMRHRRRDKIVARAILVYEYWYADCSHRFWIAPPWFPEQECPTCSALDESTTSISEGSATTGQ
jgi:hypothetical protein